MKCMVNDETIEMTEDMIKELEKCKPIKTVTDKQRISALESAVADIAVMLVGGAENG